MNINSTGAITFSARVLLTLLDEARGVPVIFAVLLPSGQVVLQVMNGACRALVEMLEGIYYMFIEYINL